MSDAPAPFQPRTAAWFARALGAPTPAQAEAWPAIAAGRHTLVSAPTGTGKTLAAFLHFIDRLGVEARAGTLREELRLIYISPLKSLAGDIRANLRRPLAGLAEEARRAGDSASPFDIGVGVRTGDTPAADRRRMAKHPPHILITTPESLYLLLTSASGQAFLKTARAVVVDELHALIGSKRGAHLMLSLARLDRLAPAPLQRIGLSATIRPLAAAAAYLAPEPVTVVAPRMEKRIDLRVVSPFRDMAGPPAGASVWEDIAAAVLAHCRGTRSAIAFVDGRLFAEKLAYYVNRSAGEGFARTHHGSLSKDGRLEVEAELRAGRLRLLCATSSMELGIDVGELDAVLQVGCPLSVASALQRLGRAGHNPGRVSVMRIFPKTASDAVFCGLTAVLAREGRLEPARGPRGCLDLLAQHLVSMAATGAYTVDEVMALLARARPFADVTRAEVEAVLRMLAGDHEHDRDLPVRPRLLYDRLHARVEGDAYSRMLATSAGGTIPDRGLFAVKTEAGVKLGELDEEFVTEQRTGHKFLLGTFAWQITRIGKDDVTVRPTEPHGATPPFFKADWSGRGLSTGRAFGRLFRQLAAAHARGGGELKAALAAMGLDEAAAAGGEGLLARQIAATGLLPDGRTLIVEHFSDDRLAHQMMTHSLFGRRVNDPLALLLRIEARRAAGIELGVYTDDYGLLAFPVGGGAVPEGLWRRLDPETARAALTAALPATPLFAQAFRHNAARSLMMGARRRGRQPLWVQRLRGAEMLDAALRAPDHPLVRETARECLEDLWDLRGVETVLRRLRDGRIRVREIATESPSPLSLWLRRQLEVAEVYDYHPATPAIRQSPDKAPAAKDMTAPAPEELARAAARRRLPENAAQVHALLMAEGDLVAGELAVPVEWLEELAGAGRVLYIDPGLWIAAEHAGEYRAALEENDAAARGRLARRLLRYRGGQTPESVAGRYAWPPAEARALLDDLVKSQAAVEAAGVYHHAELYDRARRGTVKARRAGVRTLPPERYAALLAGRVRSPAPPAEQLARALSILRDAPFPPAAWESVLLPARVGGYAPGLLDTLLARGGFFWRVDAGGGGEGGLAFHRAADLDWDAEIPLPPETLSATAQRLHDALRRRGASFVHALAAAMPDVPLADALLELLAGGHAHADSFVPVRQWLSRAKTAPAATPLRRRLRARALAMTGGRWEIARPLRAPAAEDALNAAFDRAGILCRETAAGHALPWTAMLEILRVWEYTGRARRGYFIEGLSGAQFIREADYAEIGAALARDAGEADKVLWLSAVDPAQPWGKVLAHRGGRAFLNVPGTAVALRNGAVAAVFERRGRALRVFDPARLDEALAAFAEAYAAKRIWPAPSRVTVQTYPAEAAEALTRAGFQPQMRDFVLHR